MVKTCRACTWCIKKPFSKLTIFDLDKERRPYICEALMLEEIPEITLDDERDCIDFEMRPPLLVDELAKALNKMVAFFEYLRQYPADIVPETCPGFDEVMMTAFAALGRHQKEAGDDPC